MYYTEKEYKLKIQHDRGYNDGYNGRTKQCVGLNKEERTAYQVGYFEGACDREKKEAQR